VRIVLLFPGQGSQNPHMLTAYDQENQQQIIKTFLNHASTVVGDDLLALLAQNSPSLHQTSITQPLLLGHSLAVLSLIHSSIQTHEIVCVAGHSLGELTAVAAAGFFNVDEALTLAARRAQLMQEAMRNHSVAMSVILGPLSIVLIEEILDSLDGVWLVNDNCEGQIVIGGLSDRVTQANDLLKQAGARRVLLLPMSVVSHCPLLADAGLAFRESLTESYKGFEFKSYTVASNLKAGNHSDPLQIMNNLCEQLTHRVRFREMITFLSNQTDCFIEVGTGNVLTNLVRKITTVPCLNTSTSAQLSLTFDYLQGAGLHVF
jgi:[acyl-carrier-protein] S-malonyltransferase